MQANRSTIGAAGGRRKRSHKLRCVQCRKKFESSRPKQRFCSRLCQDASYRARNRGKVKAWKDAWYARNHPPVLKVCKKCGENFESSIPWQKFCSEKCRDADHYKRHRIKILARKKKWIAANRDKARAAVRRHHAKHKDVLNAKSKARYAEKNRKLEELERIVAQRQQPPQPEASNTRGKPRDADVQARIPRIRELVAADKSWGQIQITMNRERGLNLTKRAYRNLFLRNQ